MQAAVAERLERLLAAARALADPTSATGRNAVAELTASTGLSRPNVELALRHCLEVAPAPDELEALAASIPPAPRVHVLLSSTVFVAAHRAIALALAGSAAVYVRSSRREPCMARLLARHAPGLFELVSELRPSAGDHVHAYGQACTLASVARSLPRGVELQGHGPGIGVVVIEAAALHGVRGAAQVARDVARDVVLFDQRGCLSPRLVLVEGVEEAAASLGEALAAVLGELEHLVPLGRLEPDERASITRYRDTLTFAGRVFVAGRGYVGVASAGSSLTLAPPGRNLHVVPTSSAGRELGLLAPQVTTFAVHGRDAFCERVRAELPDARRAELGRMQSPAFDGPVDRRKRAFTALAEAAGAARLRSL